MEDPETISSSGRGPVLLIERLDRRPRQGDQRLVFGHVLRRRIGPVRQQREAQLRVRIAQVVHLEPLDRLADLGVVGQEHGDGDHRARVLRHAVRQLELGKAPGTHQLRDETLHQRSRQIRRGDSREQSEQETRPGPGAGDRAERHRYGENRGGPGGDRAQIPGSRRSEPRAAQPLSDRDSVLERRLELRPPLRDEVVTRIGETRLGRPARALRLRRGDPSQLDRAPGDLELGVIAPARELLDGMAIAIARREVHFGDARPGAERFVNQADALDEIRPVGGRKQAHAGDDVANGGMRGPLFLVLTPQGTRPSSRSESPTSPTRPTPSNWS